MKTITRLKNNQGLEGLVTLPRASHLYVSGQKRIKHKQFDLSGCSLYMLGSVCWLPMYFPQLLLEERNQTQILRWSGQQAARKQSIIVAIKTIQRVIVLFRSVQPDGNRSSSLVLSDSRGCGQRGRHGWVIFDCLSLMRVASVTPISAGSDLFYYTVRIKTPLQEKNKERDTNAVSSMWQMFFLWHPEMMMIWELSAEPRTQHIRTRQTLLDHLFQPLIWQRGTKTQRASEVARVTKACMFRSRILVPKFLNSKLGS